MRHILRCAKFHVYRSNVSPLNKRSTDMAALPASNKQKTWHFHFFVYVRRATHDPHHTWCGDRWGPCHFCTPKLFRIRSVVSPLRAIEYLCENAPVRKNTCTCLSPKSDQIKKLKATYKRTNAESFVQVAPYGQIFGQNYKFWQFWGCIPTFLPL